MYFIRHGQSEFNAAFGMTGLDPGIRDAQMTARGQRQISGASQSLKDKGIARIISSPYTRALQTTAILAEELKVPVFIEPLVGERNLYSCDIGTPISTLKPRWPGYDFTRCVNNDEWWPKRDETQAELERRVQAFLVQADKEGWGNETLVVSHWYFIFTATNLDTDNGQIVFRDAAGKFHRWAA
jgi:broad specificity phosphatase PhoE